MVDVISAIAIGLLVGGIIGTLIPLVPGGLLSLAGIYLYWWNAGFAEPGTIALVVLTILGLLTLVTEFVGGALAAKAGGASWQTTAIAVVVGVVLMIVTGPIGLLVGLFGTVFLLEIVRNGAVTESARSATFATVGVLASTAIQVLLTTSILFGFLITVFFL